MNLTFRGFKFLAAIGFAAVISVPGSAKDKEGQVGLLFSGHFENADVTSDITGAKKVQLSAAYAWRYGVRIVHRRNLG